MKKIIMLGMLCMITINMLNAQTAEDVVENYISNTGGYENWKALKGIKKTLKFENRDYVDSVLVIHLKNGKQFRKTIMSKMELIDYSFDGTVAWSYASTNKDTKILSEDQTEKIRLEKEDFPNPFIDYKKKGFEIELLGKEIIKETECFVIQITKNTLFVNGQVEDNIELFFFDTKSFLPKLIVSEVKVGLARGKLKQQYVSDYRKVGDLYFPFRIEQKYKNSSMQLVEFIKSIELNPKVDDSIFMFKPKR